MNAMCAAQAVGGGECASQPQGDITLRQFLERTAGGRSFSVDAQSLRIIGQALVAWASRNAPRVTVHPADLSSARVEQALYAARGEPHCPQQRECANLRVGERFADARPRPTRSAPQ